jgi:hypothetical protein
MLPRNGCRYNDKLTIRGAWNVAVHMFDEYHSGQGKAFISETMTSFIASIIYPQAVDISMFQ